MATRLVGGVDTEFKFETVQLFKNQTLGTGSYGAVCKAKCDELPCAAKLLYPVLFDLNIPQQLAASLKGKEHRQPMRRFEAECRFLSKIKHPNIVQYIGTYHDPETNAPVLLMELMDESLTHFLETAEDPILFHIQVNILHDTALALAFLHTNGITHRDLSSNNVLLVAGSRAKVTDFGMSKFADAAAPHLASMTQCPGTPAYMPPEALKKPPVYSEKLDCFSFGVLIVQVITREFPDPVNQYQNKEVCDPNNPSQKFRALVCIPELERRESHTSLIPEAQPLRPIALGCLKDRDVDRPSAKKLCESMEELKSTPLYASSIQKVIDKDLLIQTQRETIQDKEKQLQDQQKTIQDQQEQLQTVEQEVVQLKQTAEAHKQEIKQLQTKLQQLELNKSDQQQQQPEVTNEQKSKDLNLIWRKAPKAPITMTRGSSTMIGTTVYINPYGSRDIYAFHCDIFHWSILPECPYKDSTLTSIDNKLTTVGGIRTNKVITNYKQKWVELYPPMPTARYWATVLSTATHVVVIGGTAWLNAVEILNIETKQWSTSSSLPYKINRATATLYGETLYVMGGLTASNNDYSVLSCQLRDLVGQSTPSTQTPPSSSATKVWQNGAPNLPVRRSTCVTVQGHVLAIGGENQKGKSSSAIYRYDQQRNQWTVISNMTIARSTCLATVLLDNNLLVIGGVGESGGVTDETEIALNT